jgi:Cu/Ag efflux protein CusF
VTIVGSRAIKQRGLKMTLDFQSQRHAQLASMKEGEKSHSCFKYCGVKQFLWVESECVCEGECVCVGVMS